MPLTLKQQVTEILRRGLRDGLWSTYLPGEVELSRTLQVSRMTLRTGLAALTKEGLLAASRGRKRRILRPACGKAVPAKPIVLLTAMPIELMTTLHILLIDGLRERLGRAGYVLEVQVSRGVFSGQPDRALERLVGNRPAAAWILIHSSAAMQRWFMARQIPCVIIGHAHPGIAIPSLGTDYLALGRHAAGAFLRRGHRRLALVLPDDDKAGHRHTEIGFRAAASLVPEASVQVIRHSGEPDVLARAVGQLLRQSPPTGFLVAMPQYVLTVMSALMAAGVSLPREVSLISRDSDAYLDFMRPSIAKYVINVPTYGKKISQAIQLVAQGSLPRVHEQLLQRDFVPGETLGNVSAR